MTFLKKILPLLIVAIVFAIGGYFVGSGMNTEQGAALYTGVKAVPSAITTTATSDSNQITEARCKAGGGQVLKDEAGKYYACFLPKLGVLNTGATPVAIDQQTCTLLGGNAVFGEVTAQGVTIKSYIGCVLPATYVLNNVKNTTIIPSAPTTKATKTQ